MQCAEDEADGILIKYMAEAGFRKQRRKYNGMTLHLLPFRLLDILL